VSEEPRLPLAVLVDDGGVQQDAGAVFLVADHERRGQSVVTSRLGPDLNQLRILVSEPADLVDGP
jgi:hypothetical protein